MRRWPFVLVLALLGWSSSSALAHTLSHREVHAPRLCAAARAGQRHKSHGCRLRRGNRRHQVRARKLPVASVPTTAPATVHCNLFASPNGSDSAGNGSISRPFGSLEQLDSALTPGQTGCLRAGTYGSISTWHKVDTNGAPGAQITIASYPGELATVIGYVDIEGSYTTLTHLDIDGSNTFYQGHPAGSGCPNGVSESLTIDGQNDILDHIDYYQSIPQLRGNGIGIGFWGDADNTIIRFSKIHDVGQCQSYDHLIYLSHGNNVQIYDNWLYNDPHGRGVQLYPAPTNARIFDNVVDHAGEGFVVGNVPGDVVSGNQIFHNVVTNCTGLPSEGIPGQAIHDLYGGATGTANTFDTNLLFGDPGGLGSLSAVQVSGNVKVNPDFVNAAAADFAVASASPAASWGLWNGA